jgi:hypothetical protein
MNDLHDWLLRQHHGLRTFQLLRQKLVILAVDEPDHSALYTLLALLVARYIEAFDEEPVPVSVADRAYERLQRLLADLRPSASAESRLADLNRLAAADLLDPSSVDARCSSAYAAPEWPGTLLSKSESIAARSRGFVPAPD